MDAATCLVEATPPNLAEVQTASLSTREENPSSPPPDHLYCKPTVTGRFKDASLTRLLTVPFPLEWVLLVALVRCPLRLAVMHAKELAIPIPVSNTLENASAETLSRLREPLIIDATCLAMESQRKSAAVLMV
ncbi:hypothetical protein FRB91_010103 [Serendipita sp. 411]|nr:hypothetical protein FRB91_010103 [Serendipita sp. 411]